MGQAAIVIKRAYEAPSKSDGLRVLVDRLWPRGLKREDAAIDAWLKDVAPSDGLRRWYKHDPKKWTEFRRRYLAELRDSVALAELRAMRSQGDKLTLLFAAKDAERNNAAALREALENGVRRR
ncbi:DUF488 domain-containing protein [Methylocystis heyeri]|uniref:DUF488 family protein n=1 Tax=Methylocystis heyeri TaxID=391905 RepID=A0A6B8KFP5_9HYPH|nr:DUF488 family protein [Methylocystis heyeri]QGM45805.1 DUF488 family protein [Methylocystis heyeri]